MSAYYNEIDPFAAAWLRELIKQGHIADGVVDERSIEDVCPNELREFTQCHFFAGIGVWSYALRQAGWPDDRPVWTGSCPCQPFAAIGRRAGFNDERHLWPSLHWLIKQCQPNTIFGEQVASKDARTWLDLVSADLEGENFAIGSASTVACGFGSPMLGQRIYWVGTTERKGLEGYDGDEKRSGQQGREQTIQGRSSPTPSLCNGFWGNFLVAEGNGYRKPVQSCTFPLVDGTAARVGRLRGYGNAIVAQQAQAFVEAYLEV